MTLAALGRGEELTASLDNEDIGEGWRAAGGALAMGDFGAAAAAYAELGLRPYEARARLHAAARLVGEGRRREADEHLGGALAFYRTVGATRYIREGEGLLAASA